jgi:hypothetical protein
MKQASFGVCKDVFAMKNKHTNNVKLGFTTHCAESFTIRTLGDLLRQERDNGELHWCYFGDGVVFLAAPFALVFSRVRFDQALELEINESIREARDALNLLFSHCRDISQSAEGERTLELFESKFGWKPII